LKKKKVYSLIDKYKSGNVTEDERKELFDWYRSVANQDAEFPEDEHTVEQFMRNRLMVDTQAVGKTRNKRTWLAAASVAVILGMGLLYFIKKDPHSAQNQLVRKTEIQPGRNQAVLILADGSEVSLNDAIAGNISSQSGIKISRAAAGQIVYTVLPQAITSDGQADTITRYNTIKTPVGGQFKVILSDGTQVWLNALSSLKFPLSFATKNERRVSLVGEGYFEVKKNEQAPFKVSTAKQLIEVLGTHFNVDAYPENAATKTTLLEGAVRIASGDHTVKLRPGQEAILKENFEVADVQAENAVAWKNGLFRFDGESLEAIMTIVARWYNVKVVYESEGIKRESFGVLSDRFANISTLLNSMEQTGGVKFRVQGSTVYVSSK